MQKFYDVIGSKAYLNYLNEFITSNAFDWYYMSSTAYQKETECKPYNFSFYHLLVNKSEQVSNHWSLFLPLVYELVEKSGVIDHYVARVRLGLITKAPYHNVHAPHCDFINEHKTILYYLNESDGDTFFYSNKFKLSDDKKEPYRYETFDVSYQNHYRKNSMILFDGHTYHSSSSPMHHDSRIALNINLFPIDK